MSVETAAAEAPASAGDTATPTPVTIVETPEPSLEDALGETWDKLNAEDDGKGEDGPARGPDGKFAKRDGESVEAKTEQAAAEEGSEATESGEESEAGQPEDEEVEAATPPIDPPQSWPAEMKERFSALPPEFRDIATFAAQRDKEQGDAISRMGEEVHAVKEQLTQYEPLGKVIEAYKDEFDRRGIHPAQAFSSLIQAQRMLDQNPLGGLVQLGRSYGIDLLPMLQHHGVQVQQPQQGRQQQQVDPKVAALESQLEEIKGKMTAQERLVQEAEEQRLHQMITEFAKDKPYFEEAKPVMATFLQAGHAKTLDEAYDMAVNAMPSVRERIRQEARRAEAAKREAEQKAKAEAARKSTAVNVKSGTSGSSNNPQTMDDTLNEIARRVYG